MTYSNFYSNVCMLLGTLKRGLQHRSASVTLPLSKAGLELARALRTLGVVSDVSVFQKTSRIRGGHHRMWPPGVEPATSTDTFGHPAMYMRVALAWDRGAPAWSPPGAAGALSAPLTYVAPTPETVKIISRPTAQRPVGLRELLAVRRVSPPGLFLLSTPRGLVTDVEAELMGTGGVLLAHLGLPLPHVLRVRGALRAKHAAEEAAAAAATAEGRPAPTRVPLAEWDMAGAVAAAVAPRLRGEEARRQAHAVLDGLEEREQASEAAVRAAQAQLRELALQGAAWAAREELGAGSTETARADGRLPAPRYGDSRRSDSGGGGRYGGGGSSSGGGGRYGGGGGRQGGGGGGRYGGGRGRGGFSDDRRR